MDGFSYFNIIVFEENKNFFGGALNFFEKDVTYSIFFPCIRMKGLNTQEKEGKPMEDKQIVDLYWERSETAISETARKYGKYCRYIAFNILRNDEDSKECVNDTYLRAWNSIPPHRPSVLKTFLGKITRNLSLDKYEQYNAEKRNSGQMPLILDEIQECVPASDNTENIIEEMALTEILNRFLSSLSLEQRKIFMRRYWYLSPIKEIATEYSISESKVKMSLFRSRNELKKLLEKEGISI